MKHFLPYYLLALLFITASCKSSDDGTAAEPAGEDVMWTLRVVDGGQATTLPTGATVGVFGNDASGASRFANEMLVSGQNGEVYGQVTLPAATQMSLYAYSPYNADWNAVMTVPQRFEVKADQSNLAGYTVSDLMMATGQATNGRASMNLRHMMSRIVVHVTDHSGKYDMSRQASVTLADMANTVTFQLPDGIKETLSTSVITIKPQTVNANYGRLTISAIVAPQTKQAGDKFMSVTIDGSEIPYTAPEGLATQLESGKTYIYKLLLTDSGMVPDGSYVTNWEDEGTETILQGD